MRVIFLFIFLFICKDALCQVYYIQKEYDKDITQEQLELFNRIGSNVDYIPDFERQTILAFLNYSELRNVNISFRYDNINTTMSCKPKISSILNKRIYEITINNNENFEGPLLKDVPFNAQVGVIAHELAHIVEYEENNAMGLVSLGVRYLGKGTRGEFEKNVDIITIQHGYGWQLYDWANFVQESDFVTQEYKEYKRNFYLSGDEIKDRIEEYNLNK